MNKARKTLKKQQYGLIGRHSAVKICTWTKKSLVDDGICYKQKFYGIQSHRCCQMTPSVGYCQNNCVYCWRLVDHSLDYQFDPVDKPEEIIEGCIAEQRRLINGFLGHASINREKFAEAQDPRHFAISLSGEPTMYPKLSELIATLHSQGRTTFLVTNGMLPEVLEKIELPTQLYLSLSAPNKELFLKAHQPLLKDAWQRMQRTLEVVSQLKSKTRTTARITAVKGLNMVNPEEWVGLIEKANPTFLEVKAYMFIGASRQRMSIRNMPYHEDIIEFSNQIAEHSSYRIIDEKKESRVVLMMKRDRDDRIMNI